MKIAVSVVSASVVAAAMSVSATASANIVKAGGGGAFSGLSASSTGTTITVTGNGGTVVMTCGSASLSSISGSGLDKQATFTPRYSNCSADISGIACKIDLVTPSSWTLNQGAAKSGGWGFSFTVAPWKLEFDDPGCAYGPTDCTIDFPAATMTGVSGLLKNATSNIVNLSGTLVGITWTSSRSGCGLGAGGSTATYSLNGSSGTNIAGIQLN